MKEMCEGNLERAVLDVVLKVLKDGLHRSGRTKEVNAINNFSPRFVGRYSKEIGCMLRELLRNIGIGVRLRPRGKRGESMTECRRGREPQLREVPECAVYTDGLPELPASTVLEIVASEALASRTNRQQAQPNETEG